MAYLVVHLQTIGHFLFKGLGATKVFDYRSKSLVKDLLVALQGHKLVGAYTIGSGAAEACTAVMKTHYPKLTRKFITVAGAIISSENLTTFVGKGTYLIGMMGGIIKSIETRIRTGVNAKFGLLNGLVDPDSVVSHIYMDFLPRALDQGQFVPPPPPHLVGKRLDNIQEALHQRKGVSKKKLVVML